MPYQELTALDIRKEMVNEYLSNNYTITELLTSAINSLQ
jgi:hypothetical protein